LIHCSILPSLDDYDILDILLYFNIGQPNYEQTVRDMIEMNKLEIQEDDIQKVMPLTLELIEWLIKFQRLN
jgi:hypothetical protein